MTDAQQAFETARDVLEMIIKVRYGYPKMVLLSGINGATLKITVELDSGQEIPKPHEIVICDGWTINKDEICDVCKHHISYHQDARCTECLEQSEMIYNDRMCL